MMPALGGLEARRFDLAQKRDRKQDHARVEPAAERDMIKQTILVLAVLASGCAANESALGGAGPTPLEQGMIADGRDIAEAQCAACHAVGPYGDSPNSAAPALRRVLSRYNADVLEEELIQGIQVAHPMPEFQFNPQGVDALIAYLRAIREPSAAVEGS
jgi:mono/diheme cytochrome c family protein